MGGCKKRRGKAWRVWSFITQNKKQKHRQKVWKPCDLWVGPQA